MNDGRIVSTDGLDIAADSMAHGVPRTAGRLVARPPVARSRRTPVPPRTRWSRITLDADRLHPLAAAALARTGLAAEIAVNPYRSIVARAVELVDATAEALDLVDAYRPPADAGRAVAAGSGQRRPGRPRRPAV